MSNRIRLYHIDRGSLPPETGNKALNLRFLVRKGFPVPESYVLDPNTCFQFGRGGSETKKTAEALLSRHLDSRLSYAVRSSAGVEDQPGRSYAGQFLSLLSVKGIRPILDAAMRVYRSAESVEESMYHRRGDSMAFPMAVIIQEMVNSVASGVAFSRNPLTGLREIVVEAVSGSGEQLVQDGVTPFRWRSKWGEYIEKSDTARISTAVVEQVITGAERIEKVFGKPADLEWVWDGKKLWWVQLREMTGIDDISIFSNRISREFLPGLIKPLVWSVNIPVVNTAWIRLLCELTGPGDIKPEDLARSFHYRAYFNMSTMGRAFEKMGMPYESLELLLGIESTGPDKPSFKPSLKTMFLLPRMGLWVFRKRRFANQTVRFLEEMGGRFAAREEADLSCLSEMELLNTAVELQKMATETAYFNVVVPLLMQLYYRLVERTAEKAGLSSGEWDIAGGDSRISDMDPGFHLARLNKLFRILAPDLQAALHSRGYQALESPDMDDFRIEVESFIRRFGHFSDSGNDFSTVPWREKPEQVLSMILKHRPEQQSGGKQPPNIRGLSAPYLLSRARRFRLLREQVSSLYTYGYGLLRNVYLELGRRLSDRGLLNQPEDILYLNQQEAGMLVEIGGTDFIDRVNERRRDMETSAEAILPSILFGDDTPPIYESTGKRMKGIPTSRGYYSGPVRVIRQTDESEKLKTGDVLVIPYSDVGWTPLFVRAGALISESGGILSHSSIVAREYGIPAVVSVTGALELKDGVRVTVDGYTGEIITQEVF